MNEYDWKILKKLEPSIEEKESTRERILHSIKESQSSKKQIFVYWRGLATGSILLIICVGFLWGMLQGESFFNNSSQPDLISERISWGSSELNIERVETGFLIYDKNGTQVGTIAEVTEDGMNEIVKNSPMFVEEKLHLFPYNTSLYIEHMKKMEVSQRYHFFLSLLEGKLLHITFDYPKLEYAEIFSAITSLKIEGVEQYIHNEPLYVKHGYDELLYPVDIKPISNSKELEVYYWESASQDAFRQYLKRIVMAGWKEETISEQSSKVVLPDALIEVTISFNPSKRELTYEFTYNH